LTGNSAGLRTVFSVVFHTENCAVHSGNPTVSSFYLPTPRWHHLKALKLNIRFQQFIQQMSIAWYIPFQIPLLTPYFTLLYFFSDNIMADVASKQQTTALFLTTIVTRTRRHTELTKKLTNLMGNLCCAREHTVQFFVQFFYTKICTV
jgi:hypothetical protein